MPPVSQDSVSQETEESTPSASTSTSSEENQDFSQVLDQALETSSQWEISDVSSDIEIEKEIKITSNLKVLGRASLSDTSIAGQLTVDASIVLDSNGINSLTGPLYLNSLGLGPVDILAGKVVIDIEGNVKMVGNLAVGGKIEAGRLVLGGNNFQQDQNPKDSKDEESGFGKLLEIKNSLGETVASIDASGSAQFASLAIAADYSATQSANLAEFSTNATAGLGILHAGERETIIYNQKITNNTLIYITPISSTENQVLYVKAKKAGNPEIEKSGWFKVGVDYPINHDIKFNWWIIN